MERLYSLHIFCDFDGTISGIDIGFDLFGTFGEREPWRTMMLEGKLTAAEFWRHLAESLRTPFTEEMLDEYLREIPIDPGFSELMELVRRENIPFTIVSDGMDLYIERFLHLHGFDHIPRISNHARLTDEGRMEVEFPHAAEGCECPSACCKRNVLLLNAGPEDRIIYIGDGISDACPAEFSDVVFAKGRLAAHCNQYRIPHYPYKSFTDVAARLRDLLGRRRLRSRHQALLKRKRAWEAE